VFRLGGTLKTDVFAPETETMPAERGRPVLFLPSRRARFKSAQVRPGLRPSGLNTVLRDFVVLAKAHGQPPFTLKPVLSRLRTVLKGSGAR